MPSLTAKVNKLERLARTRRRKRTDGQPTAADVLAALRRDPAETMRRTGLTPDAWQADLLRCTDARLLVCCSRQVGKSQTAAALGLNAALLRPHSLVLLLSPSERQSGELAAKLFGCYDALGQPVATRKRTELQLHLVNGSRVIALPENERTIRGYSGAALLIIDEASRVSDTLYSTIRPMLAVSRGRLVVLSTPFGKRGWFFEAWQSPEPWKRIEIKATQCARIAPEFLAEEERTLGPRWFRQEYMVSWEDTIDAVFSNEDIRAALTKDVKPLLLEGFPHG